MLTATTRCPYCYGRMHVRALLCETCSTEIRADFVFSGLLRLSQIQQEFVVRFVLASGSLKEMAKVLGVSYPTVRGRLDRIIEALEASGTADEDRRAGILDALEEKRISAEEAAGLLSSVPDDADEQKKQ